MNRRFFYKRTAAAAAAAKKSATAPAAAATAPPPTAATTYMTDEYKETILENSYLSARGMTIPKSVLHPADERDLKKELSVKKNPAMGSPVAAADDEIVFAYRENEKKIYIPRFYAEKRYGAAAHHNKIGAGEDMSSETQFAGELREYQTNIINTYLDYVRAGGASGGGGLLSVPCGRGKCLAYNTKILMYDGTIKYVQDVVVGDVIMGDDSTPRNVLSLARGREKMYKVCGYGGGAEYTVNESHILSLKLHSNIHLENQTVDISVKDYLKIPAYYRPRYGYRVPIVFPETQLECNPYIFGLNIRDGKIPHNYKCNSRANQLKLLAGIIDAGGLIHSEYSTNYFDIIWNSEDIVFLCRSLGFFVFFAYGKGIQIYGRDLHEIPVARVRACVPDDTITVDKLTYRIALEELGEDDYYGFEIDGNRRFVLGDMTVTHNTVMAIKIATELRKKTLIIVHKEFLMNQWIERICDFCGGSAAAARIGKIRGEIFDIEGKDFVIGMLQTLYNKPYPDNAFNSFGLVIVDETHRICSEQFSRALFRFSPRYCLGISATIERKDGMEQLLTMFMGEIIYKEDRTDDDPVCVRAIEYISHDEEFNRVEYTRQGTVQYATMLAKVCNEIHRSELVIRVIQDLLKENPEQQIMVLAHQKVMLTYIHDAIVERGISEVGYYIGGMKQKHLDETAEKQVVIATYAMAQEALDIKTLSTLILATPKTDIVQSVGRILRMKHKNPVIVDIIDPHDVFKNQWSQRKKFYKSCNYRIRQIKSDKYAGMSIDWATDKTWRRVYEPTAGAAAAAADDEDGGAAGAATFENAKIVFGKCMIRL